ncbi:MAG: hydroxymyristoyl-ACP dehydratase [Bacillota bacterium]
MTTINCSSNCVHQQDGKCTLDNVTKNSTSVTSDCVFFEEKVAKLTGKK